MEIAAFIISIITIVLIGFELVLNFRNNRKERNIKAVTEQRAIWIQKVRELFKDIINLFDSAIDSLIKIERNLSSAANGAASIKPPETNELRNKYNELRLLLNFENDADIKLIKAIEDLVCRIDLEALCAWLISFPDYDIYDFVASKELILLYMNIYLKSEWERLKKESKTGETSSKYFEEKYKELTNKNKIQIDKLSEKAYRIKLSEIKHFIESDTQFKQINIAAYNCLNLLETVDFRIKTE